ncbi:hypothetical protein [Paracraurococcus ruber]|uniref:Uncharacterized protein n=1 Tax=Paracraurococcus ruber TaxID=77675 RepID=A0ABS1D3A0_9PROT|nr:hypothetical protein [Paracraurococcus ruber]MBK1661274.1 hypothetical protein [Paracraurococcus ruber]TDG23902.1 hypothetical protein E2C05_26300 [Paracraurococcus ruber]
MQSLNVLAAHGAFLMIALLAGLVTALNHAGDDDAGAALNLGAAVFLGQFCSFVALAGLGLPTGIAQAAALVLGAAAAWTAPRAAVRR